jgi:hypothetical protein
MLADKDEKVVKFAEEAQVARLLTTPNRLKK